MTAREEEPDTHGVLEDFALAGSLGEGATSFLRPKEPVKSPLQEVLDSLPKVDSGHIVAEIKAKTGFHEMDSDLGLSHRLADRVMTLVRHFPGGREERYSDKLQREEKKGHKEAASYGTAKIGDKEFMLFTMHWDFFAGSLGIVAGEKFKRAARAAQRRKMPLVGVFSSAGVRQHENFAGLQEMSRITYEISQLKEATKVPYVSVLVGEVWGGISASAVPLGDVKIAFEGSNFGFTGPRVIESFTGEKIPPGSQSAAAHTLRRNVDVLVKDSDEMIALLAGLFVASDGKNRGSIGLQNLLPIHSLTAGDRFSFTKGFSTGFTQASHVDLATRGDIAVLPKKDTSTETLEARVQELLTNSARPDTEFLLRSCFDEVVPLYSRLVLADGSILYPAIIAGIGKIGGQRFLVIGNQPSYKRYFDTLVMKVSASPTPADFRYVQSMLLLGERYGLPAVFFTDTPGAKPTLDAEFVGQSYEIAQTLKSTNRYKYPTIAIVTGMLGSGGGLATTPIVDHVAMLSRAMAFVAEPTSLTSIIYNEPNPDREKVVITTNTIGATAAEQFKLGLIDSVIDEPPGGAETNPWEAAEAIRNHIASIGAQDLLLSTRRLRNRREKRIARPRKIPLNV